MINCSQDFIEKFEKEFPQYKYLYSYEDYVYLCCQECCCALKVSSKDWNSKNIKHNCYKGAKKHTIILKKICKILSEHTAEYDFKAPNIFINKSTKEEKIFYMNFLINFWDIFNKQFYHCLENRQGVIVPHLADRGYLNDYKNSLSIDIESDDYLLYLISRIKKFHI